MVNLKKIYLSYFLQKLLLLHLFLKTLEFLHNIPQKYFMKIQLEYTWSYNGQFISIEFLQSNNVKMLAVAFDSYIKT